jgi:hypothetical protein
VFVFRYEKAEALSVVITAPGGHRAECRIAEADLAVEGEKQAPPREVEERSRLRDLAAGLGLVLGLAAFAVSWANHRRIRKLRDELRAFQEQMRR